MVPPKTIKTLGVTSRTAWRNWLKKHHDSHSRIWLVFHKRHTGRPSPSYDDAVEEALCFRWIDSLIRRLDEDRYARLFTPRKANSRWSTANRRRYADLQTRGLLAVSGVKRAPTRRSGDAPRPSVSAIPSYIMQALKTNTRAQRCFEELAPSYRRMYISWIGAAKREETKQKRLREAITLLAAGKKLGLK